MSRRTRRLVRRRVVKALKRCRASYREEPAVTPRTEVALTQLSQSTDVDTLKLRLKASICKSSFYEFVKAMWDIVVAEPLIDNWHIRYICRQMQNLAERVFKGLPKKHDLIINVPPGSSKSTICSILFPAWVWTRMLTARLICCSYSEGLSLRLSRKCRDVIKSQKYQTMFPHVKIRTDQDTASEFSTPQGGARYALGSGTQVMGSHAHFILIDDPIDPEGVLSDKELARINNWIEEQLSGRKVDKLVSVTVMIAQRLHQSDPPAMMGERKPVKWVKIPATDEYPIRPKRLRRFYKDGLMDPRRLPRQHMKRIGMGPRGQYILAGQFGQRPTPPGGGDFKTDRLVLLPKAKRLPRFKAMCRFWDKAGTKCLIAGTQIMTARGLVSIEEVTSKDQVLTREGFKRVKWAGQTARVKNLVEVRLSDGRTVTGTPDHKIWLENKGWIPLDTVRVGDYTYSIAHAPNKESNPCREDASHLQTRKSCGSTVSDTVADRANGTTRGTARSADETAGTSCTGRCGDTTTGRSPRDRKSTTRMKTTITTTSTTSNVSPRGNTSPATPGGAGILTASKSLTGHESKRGGGTPPTKTLRSTDGSVGLGVGPRRSQPRGGDSSVNSVSTTLSGRPTNSQSGTARSPVGTRIESGSQSGSGASGVTSGSRLGGGHGVAVTRVRRISGGMTAVYDIMVEDTHEFFAEGILVHNSGGAYTVGVLMGMTPDNRIYIVDVIRVQLDSFEREKLIRQTARLDGVTTTVGIEQSGGEGGKESAENTVRRLSGFKVKVLRPGREDKQERAEPFTVQVNAGNVYIPKRHWYKSYVSELNYFPHGTYKDQVDASAGALTILTRTRKVVGGMSRGPIKVSKTLRGIHRIYVV